MRAHDISPSINGFWENQSFHNYADYAMRAGFQSGLARLRELGCVQRCAVMCAEAVWCGVIAGSLPTTCLLPASGSFTYLVRARSRQQI